VHRRDTSASRSKQVAEALQNQKQFKPYSGPVKAPALITVNAITPVVAKVPALVDRSNVTPPKKAVGDWTIAEKLADIVVRAADSGKLSHDTQQQLKGMLSDPKFLAWLIGSLLVWFVSQFFVVGEILDMLLVGAAMILTGTGIFFALQSLVGAAHLIGEFVEATRNAKDEKDLDAAADILANIIVMIGITVLIAALTHATTRATSAGEKVSTVKKPPPERAAPVAKLQERPKAQDTGGGGPGNTSKGGTAPRTKSLREQYLGRTPGKKSRTGREVIERMEKEGKIRTNPRTGMQEFKASNGKWYNLSEADMAHKTDAVTWWNKNGRTLGPKSAGVRSWMLDSDNYYLEHFSINRSQGATLGQSQTYLPPE
jgi:hypothetical protein